MVFRTLGVKLYMEHKKSVFNLQLYIQNIYFFYYVRTVSYIILLFMTIPTLQKNPSMTEFNYIYIYLTELKSKQ